MRPFPKLAEGEVALAVVEVDTGIPLNLKGVRHRAAGGEVYRVFATLADARTFAEALIVENASLECAIFASDRPAAEIIRHASVTGLEETPSNPSPLDYERPTSSSSVAARVIAGVAGGLVILFAVSMLLFGIASPLLMVFAAHRGVTAGDGAVAVVCVAVGAFAWWAGFRCLRSCLRGQ